MKARRTLMKKYKFLGALVDGNARVLKSMVAEVLVCVTPVIWYF